MRSRRRSSLGRYDLAVWILTAVALAGCAWMVSQGFGQGVHAAFAP